IFHGKSGACRGGRKIIDSSAPDVPDSRGARCTPRALTGKPECRRTARMLVMQSLALIPKLTVCDRPTPLTLARRPGRMCSTKCSNRLIQNELQRPPERRGVADIIRCACHFHGWYRFLPNKTWKEYITAR